MTASRGDSFLLTVTYDLPLRRNARGEWTAAAPTKDRVIDRDSLYCKACRCDIEFDNLDEAVKKHIHEKHPDWEG